MNRRSYATRRVHWTTAEAVEELAAATGAEIIMGGGYASVVVEAVEWRCELPGGAR